MIYLIDDTNLESVNGTFLHDEKYKHILRRVESVEELSDQRDKFDTAECIMVHRTFANSSVYKEQLAELTGDGDIIPFVVFSAGDSEHAIYDEKFPNVIEGIKKVVFYSRLAFFLDSYISNKCIDLKLLAYGKDYLKIKVRSLALSIFDVIAGKDGEITNSELASIANCPGFKELVLLSYPELGYTYDELLEELEDNQISFFKFKNNINQIVNSFYQYGKNIYIWK